MLEPVSAGLHTRAEVLLYRNAARIAILTLLCSLAWIAAACVLWSVNTLRNAQDFMLSSHTAEGVITARAHASTGPSGQGMPYLLTYRVVLPDGRHIMRTESVSPSTYGALQPGAAVTVLYTADGSDARLDVARMDAEGTGTVPLAMAFGAGLMLWAIHHIVLNARALWNDARLTLHGHVLPAQVLACQRVISPQERGVLDYTPMYARFEIDLRYRFTTPTGKVIQRTARQNRADLARSPLPGFGTGAAVLYLDDHHFRVL